MKVAIVYHCFLILMTLYYMDFQDSNPDQAKTQKQLIPSYLIVLTTQSIPKKTHQHYITPKKTLYSP